MHNQNGRSAVCGLVLAVTLSSGCGDDDAAIDAGTGDDDAGQPTIDAAPVVPCTTSFATDEIVAGDIVIANDLDAQVLAGKRAISGDLLLQAAGTGPIALPDLEYVGGGLTVAGATASLSLPALCHVETSIAVSVGSPLTALSVPALREVGGDLTLYAEATTSAAFPLLHTIPGHFWIYSPLSSLAAPSLTAIGGQLALRPREAGRTLTDLAAFSSLTSLSSLLVEQSFIEDLRGLGGIRALPGGLVLVGNGRLASLDGLGLAAGPIGAVEIDGNPLLVDIDALAPATSVVPAPIGPASAPSSGAVRIVGNDGLTSVAALASLSSVPAGITILGNDRLVEVDWPTLTTAGVLIVGGLGADQGNGALQSVHFAALRTLTSPGVGRTPPPGLDVSGNPVLTSIAFPALVSAESAVRFASDPQLPACQAEALRSRVTLPGGRSFTVVDLGAGTCP